MKIMNILYNARRMGKTTKMIGWLKTRRDRVLITFNEARVSELNKQFECIRNRGQIMTLRTYLKHAPVMPRTTKVSIDDADKVLQNFIRHDIQNITLSEQ